MHAQRGSAARTAALRSYEARALPLAAWLFSSCHGRTIAPDPRSDAHHVPAVGRRHRLRGFLACADCARRRLPVQPLRRLRCEPPRCVTSHRRPAVPVGDARREAFDVGSVGGICVRDEGAELPRRAMDILRAPSALGRRPSTNRLASGLGCNAAPICPRDLRPPLTVQVRTFGTFGRRLRASSYSANFQICCTRLIPPRRGSDRITWFHHVGASLLIDDHYHGNGSHAHCPTRTSSAA
jgi:hypothetical protein